MLRQKRERERDAERRKMAFTGHRLAHWRHTHTHTHTTTLKPLAAAAAAL